MLESYKLTHGGFTFHVKEIDYSEVNPAVRVLRVYAYLAKPGNPSKPITCYGGDISLEKAWRAPDEEIKNTVALFVGKWVETIKTQEPDLVQMVV
jgi:hypothetical protein